MARSSRHSAYCFGCACSESFLENSNTVATNERKGKRGKLARSKARNLLERLRNFEDDVLRFMDEMEVPFSNNQAENDLRMTKVQQKISGCFRSVEVAKIFCRIRSYLSTCRKQGLTASEALRLLFQGKRPPFMAEA